MRHGSLDLTMQTYTDPRLLDVAGALDEPPKLPIDDAPRRQRAKVTGTDGPTLVPVLVPDSDNASADQANADKRQMDGRFDQPPKVPVL